MALSYEERRKEEEKARINARILSEQMRVESNIADNIRIQSEQKKQEREQERERINAEVNERKRLQRELIEKENELKAIDNARRAVKERYSIFVRFLPEEDKTQIVNFHEALLDDVKDKIDTKFLSATDSIQLYIVKYIEAKNDSDILRILGEFAADFVHYVLIECIEYSESQERARTQEEANKKAEEERQKKQMAAAIKQAANKRLKTKMGKRALWWFVATVALFIIGVLSFSGQAFVFGYICLLAAGGCAVSAIVHLIVRSCL